MFHAFLKTLTLLTVRVPRGILFQILTPKELTALLNCSVLGRGNVKTLIGRMSSGVVMVILTKVKQLLKGL